MWVTCLCHDELTLLEHRSGIGGYLDEEAEHDITEYPQAVPPQDRTSTERYLAVLCGHHAKFRSGERFSYGNSRAPGR